MAAPRKSAGKPGDTHVALMRGINVAGKNKLPMKELVALFDEAGCRDVRTYIQSGNVVFRANATLARRIPTIIAEQIAARFGLRVPVVMRTAEELRAVAKGNPFLKKGQGTDAFHVAFLAHEPAATKVKALAPDRSPGDTFVVRGREIYLCCPNGYGRSKLGNDWFDRTLETTSTIRNWRTVLELVAMVG